MKASIIKKLMLGVLTASLVMAPVMGVFATDEDVPGESQAEEAISEATEGTVTSVAEVPASSSVAGTKSTVSGVYLARKVEGTAVATPVATISQDYGLAKGEKAVAKFSDMNPKKSYLAKQCMDAAASSQGATIGPMLNIEFGKMSGGKYSLLPTDGAEIRISVGLPKDFAQEDGTYAVIRVRTGGVVTILKDMDNDPKTVTFDTTGGAGAYALIKY